MKDLVPDALAARRKANIAWHAEWFARVELVRACRSEPAWCPKSFRALDLPPPPRNPGGETTTDFELLQRQILCAQKGQLSGLPSDIRGQREADLKLWSREDSPEAQASEVAAVEEWLQELAENGRRFREKLGVAV